jgi:hypothetical protein
VSLSAAVLDALIATGATRAARGCHARDIAEREAEEAAKLEAAGGQSARQATQAEKEVTLCHA